jgi:hypothetical protein
MNSSGSLGFILTWVPSLIFAVVYTAAAWIIYRRWRLIGVAILWLCCSAAYGYMAFGPACPFVFTCNVPASEVAYLRHVGLFYALVGAIGFLGATAVVIRAARSAGIHRLRGTELVSGTLATVAGWILAWMFVPKPFSW